ncbi:hypothetical protein QNN11_03775 [Phocaeicola dorei]|uniref:Uncharacterized protein n=1 Tax=Phocaeicola dorei TaxID=357276 RepID=A0AA95KPE6_9BACT|nr:hypothetical protein QNN11_03775 [Phocaeicola dorei]
MKEFKSKGISLENMVGADPMKEKNGEDTGKAYNQTIVLTEDLVWELRTFAADHRYRGVKTVIEAMIGCFLREDGTLDRDRLEQFWKEYVKK